MIRLLYWLMVLGEIVLIIATLLLFAITDSRTIHIFAEDILEKNGIEYEKISGNLFTGIEIQKLKYSNKKLVERASIHWNPFALLNNRINITQLEIEGVDPETIISIINSLPSSDGSEKIDFNFGLDIQKIKITANPFLYHGVDFKEFFLATDRLELDKDIFVRTEPVSFSFNSNLVDIDFYGKIENRDIHFDNLNIKNLNTRVITSFVKSINRELEKSPKKVIKDNVESENKVVFPIESIKIDNSFISLDRITYGPITLEKTELELENITVDPKNSFSVDAKKAVLLGDTSFADTKQVGFVKDSMLYGTGDIITRKHLFDKYSLPLNRKGLNRLPAKLKVNHRGLWVDIDSSNIDKLLVLKNGFNVDMKKTEHRLDYIYLDEIMTIKSTAKATMSYSDDCDIKSLVTIDMEKDGYTVYEGSVDVKKITNIPAVVVKSLLGNLRATYKGDADRLTVRADSKQIEGDFFTEGYENAKMHLESKKPVPIVGLVPALPDGLKDSKGDISSDSFIDFSDNSKTKIDIDIISDILNLKGTMGIDEPYIIELTGTDINLAKISKIDKNIKAENIGTISGKVILNKDNKNHIDLNSRDLKLEFDYNHITNKLSNGLAKIGTDTMSFNGNFDSQININSKIKNIDRFSKNLKPYYNISIPKIEGGVDVDVKINADKSVDIDFKSKRVIYSGLKFDALSGNFSVLDNQIEINHYDFKFYNDYINSFLSNKKSYLTYKDGLLSTKGLWVRDDFLVSGEYNIDKSIGELSIKSDKFHFINIDFDISTKLDLKLKIDKEKLYISGDITPLKDNIISYELFASDISEDSDIVIVKEKKVKKSNMLDSLKTYITIKSNNPLRYKTDDIDIKFVNDIAILKDYNRVFKVYGATIIKGGYIRQVDKQFFLDESHIYFSGNPQKPLLDIKANYHKDQYDIQIFISGTTDDPIINFNSDPYLSQKEILSLILFDATGSNGGSGTQLYALLGGTFAKELMKALGISVDHLILGQGIDEKLSVEVGKKISDDITMIYQYNNGRNGVKIKVDHNKNFETDIIIQPPDSSSIEFLYKQDR